MWLAIAASGRTTVIGPVMSLPSSRYDPYDAPYANPALLFRADGEATLSARDAANAILVPKATSTSTPPRISAPSLCDQPKHGRDDHASP